jgi:AIPR protein
MDQITSSLLETFSEKNDVRNLEQSKQFEHFANYCVVSKVNRSSFDLDDIHTGSGGDSSIDGLCIIANGKIVTEQDELTEIVDGPGHLDLEVVFIQTKTTSSFSGSDIGSFIHGVKDFLADQSKLVQNDRIKSMKELWAKAISMSSFMVNRRPFCKLFYVCTGKWVADQNLQAILDGGRAELEAIGIFDDIAVTPVGANEIQKLFNETKNKLSTTITVQNKITLPDIEGVKEAYLGVLPFQEFVKLIQDENQTIHNIFDDNVRDFQGENAVNKRIKETLVNGKFALFCVLNNGVTVIASSLTPAGNRFTLRDYQIVNGCQTSNVLHDCQKIDEVSVPIKIIVTESDDIKTEITVATNSQTEVKTEQLEALKAFQKRLELYFSSDKSSIRLYYERRSQQYNSMSGVKRSQIISIPTQIKAFASAFLESPHLVSGYYGTIVKRFKGKIFAEDHKFLPYFLSALCYYRIEQFFRSGEVSVDFKKARFHIIMIVRILGMGSEMAALSSNKLEKACAVLRASLLDDAKAIQLFSAATDIFSKSGIDLNKRQYKSEADTELLRAAAKNYLMASSYKV